MHPTLANCQYVTKEGLKCGKDFIQVTRFQKTCSDHAIAWRMQRNAREIEKRRQKNKEKKAALYEKSLHP